MDVNGRLIQIREELGLKIAQFAKEIDVPRTSLIGWEGGKSVPIETAAKLKTRFNINVDWFLTGEGGMFLNDKTDNCIDYDEPNTEVQVIDPKNMTFVKKNRLVKGVDMPTILGAVVGIPLMEQTASAGFGQELIESDQAMAIVPIVETFLAPHKAQNCKAIKVVGDSMSEISLMDKDYVIFDMSQLDASGGGLFVVTFRGTVLVKRVEFNVEESVIYLRSENKRYNQPYKATKQEIEDGTLKIEGKVVAWIHRHWY